MATAPSLSRSNDAQRLVHTGCTWSQFKLIQAGFEASPNIRLFYYQDTLEILMPGRNHEVLKSLIGFLIELFLVEIGMEFEPTGSMTQEREGIVSLQADESYCIGGSKPISDLAIEVVFISGGPDKLPRYQALAVTEVWFWQNDRLQLYRLQAGNYEQIDRSELPGLDQLDIGLLERCVILAQTSKREAVEAFRQGYPAPWCQSIDLDNEGKLLEVASTSR
jgi:Uma2 family endonuclease